MTCRSCSPASASPSPPIRVSGCLLPPLSSGVCQRVPVPVPIPGCERAPGCECVCVCVCACTSATTEPYWAAVGKGLNYFLVASPGCVCQRLGQGAAGVQGGDLVLCGPELPGFGAQRGHPLPVGTRGLPAPLPGSTASPEEHPKVRERMGRREGCVLSAAPGIFGVARMNLGCWGPEPAPAVPSTQPNAGSEGRAAEPWGSSPLISHFGGWSPAPCGAPKPFLCA